MEESLSKIIKGLEEGLGPNWKVTPRPIFGCVYYFDCSTFNQMEVHCLTHSYGIYKENDIDGIIKKELHLLKDQYAKRLRVLGI